MRGAPDFAGAHPGYRRYGLRPISTTMTAGRCSICGPAEAETPAMMPSAISAAASNCAIRANSLARLAATKMVTPELGTSGTPAGGSATARAKIGRGAGRGRGEELVGGRFLKKKKEE